MKDLFEQVLFKFYRLFKAYKIKKTIYRKK